jgi:hypothetical protein
LHAIEPHPDASQEYTPSRPGEDTCLDRQLAHEQLLAVLDPERLRAAREAARHLQ